MAHNGAPELNEQPDWQGPVPYGADAASTQTVSREGNASVPGQTTSFFQNDPALRTIIGMYSPLQRRDRSTEPALWREYTGV